MIKINDIMDMVNEINFTRPVLLIYID